MRARIKYINENTTTVIENRISFEDFINSLFKKKIYLSIAKEGVNLAINTDNIIFVEEIETSQNGTKTN